MPAISIHYNICTVCRMLAYVLFFIFQVKQTWQSGRASPCMAVGLVYVWPRFSCVTIEGSEMITLNNWIGKISLTNAFYN